MRQLNRLMFLTSLLASTAPLSHAADPWADAVVHYDGGTDPDAGYTTASAALGAPTRFTIDPYGFFDAVVTPANPPFGYNEVVSIGAGGSLTLRFDEPVADDPLNPYGIDLIVFGNSFLLADFFSPNPTQIVNGISSDGGVVSVSADGVTYFELSGEADGMFPTNAYVDVTDPFTQSTGFVESDFTRPVNPAFNPIGLTYAQVLAGYNGSGGGLGLDISPTGLSSISFVRISNLDGAIRTVEIDAVADVSPVPEPAAQQLILFALIFLGKSAAAANVKRAGGNRRSTAAWRGNSQI